MATIDENHCHIKTMIIDTISLMLKNGIKFNKQFKVEGVVGITIDDSTAMIVKLEQLVESDMVRIPREAEEERKRKLEELKRAEEIEQIVEERTRDRVRKRQTELAKIEVAQKRARIDNTLTVDDDDNNQTLTSSPEKLSILPDCDNDDADIKVEADGTFWIGKLYYKPSSVSNLYIMFAEGYRYRSLASAGAGLSSWACKKQIGKGKVCTARVKTSCLKRFGHKGPGRFLSASGEHNHPPQETMGYIPANRVEMPSWKPGRSAIRRGPQKTKRQKADEEELASDDDEPGERKTVTSLRSTPRRLSAQKVKNYSHVGGEGNSDEDGNNDVRNSQIEESEDEWIDDEYS